MRDPDAEEKVFGQLREAAKQAEEGVSQGRRAIADIDTRLKSEKSKTGQASENTGDNLVSSRQEQVKPFKRATRA